MRRQFNIVLLLVLIAGLVGLAGCPTLNSKQKEEVHLQQVTLGTFVKHMDDGKTDRATEQEMLRASWEAYLVLDWAVNDDEEAKALLDKKTKENPE